MQVFTVEMEKILTHLSARMKTHIRIHGTYDPNIRYPLLTHKASSRRVEILLDFEDEEKSYFYF